MGASPEAPAASSAWIPLRSGFSRHGIVGKFYILLHATLAVLLLLSAAIGLAESFGGVLVIVTAVAIQLTLAITVALHKRFAIVAALALSVLGCVISLYRGIEVTRHLGWLALALGAAGVNAMFAWYFGQLQRAATESLLASAGTDSTPEQ